MSQVLTDVVVNQEEFAVLEMEFATLYQAACTTETAIFTAKLAASVAAHRLGTLAARLKPMVEATEGKGSWGNYLQRHDMAARTVQRAMRIARWLDEDTCSKITLTDADDLCAAKEANKRGNTKLVGDWQNFKKKLAEAREALETQESQREKDLAEFQKELEDKAQKDYEEEAKALDSLANRAAQLLEADAKALADANSEKLTAKEMADALKAENKASLPESRAQGETMPRDPMPRDLAAELQGYEVDEDNDNLEEDVESEESLEEADLLDADQIEQLSVRLLEIVSERPSELGDAISDPQVNAALDTLVAACNGDAEIVYGVISVWCSNRL